MQGEARCDETLAQFACTLNKQLVYLTVIDNKIEASGEVPRMESELLREKEHFLLTTARGSAASKSPISHEKVNHRR